jgi:hypothetical protein
MKPPTDNRITKDELEKHRALLEKQMIEECGKVPPEIQPLTRPPMSGSVKPARAKMASSPLSGTLSKSEIEKQRALLDQKLRQNYAKPLSEKAKQDLKRLREPKH